MQVLIEAKEYPGGHLARKLCTLGSLPVLGRAFVIPDSGLPEAVYAVDVTPASGDSLAIARFSIKPELYALLVHDHGWAEVVPS